MKVKFLTVIWGDRYIEEFSRVSLPSYLADGNLPHLAEQTDLEILIMTSESSRPAFDREPTIRALTALCPVRFVYIDDLITTGLYGVTLTLAYVRGIADSGPDQVETYFVFMNADFILADGAMRSLVERLRRGDRCIMAPSLRARSETILPALAAHIDRDRHTLTMRPRDMVRLALENLHPTVIGKTITQEFITCMTHNQIYWQVNDSTLLGHYHLVFMLAIKPEVTLGSVNSYCDYGFVPELVPSGKFSIFDDSDDFFMLELQPTNQEKQLLRCGVSTVDEVAAELSRWTTREHRRFAEVNVVFHAEKLPSDIDDHRAVARNYIQKLHAKLSRRPIDHADHYYWRLGVLAWLALRCRRHDGEDNPAPPPELGVTMVDGSASNMRRYSPEHIYHTLVKVMRQRRGLMPHVAIWHYLWLDSQLILRWLRSAAGQENGRSLIVYGHDSALAEQIAKVFPADTIIAKSLLKISETPNSIYQNILLHIDERMISHTSIIVEETTKLLKPGGVISIYFYRRDAELDFGDFSVQLAGYVDKVFHSTWIEYKISASFAGGRLKHILRLIELIFLRRLSPGRLRDLPVLALSAIGWPIVAALTAANNFRLRNPSAACPPYCSSALVSLTKPRHDTLPGSTMRLGEDPQRLVSPAIAPKAAVDTA
ncbi:MAG: hypothetical protein ACTS3R_18905 [Inquilinaceae bacterium]